MTVEMKLEEGRGGHERDEGPAPRMLSRMDRMNTAELRYIIGEKPALVQTRLLLVLQVLVVILQVLVVFKDFWIVRSGSLSSKLRTIYTVGTAIVASSLSMMSFNFVKAWWLHSLHLSGRPLLERQRMVHLALGLGTLGDWLRFWPMSIAFLTLTLYTAAIVTSLAPFQANDAVGRSNPLLHTTRGGCIDKTSEAPPTDWLWRDPNGTWVSYNPSNHAQQLCQYSEFNSLQHYLLVDGDFSEIPTYAVGQVAVYASAAGAPIDHSQNVPNPFTAMGLEYSTPAFVSTSACLPVFERNPVKCERTFDFSFPKNESQGMVKGCPLHWDAPHVRGARGRLGMGVCTNTTNYELGKIQVISGTTADFTNQMYGWLNTGNYSAREPYESQPIEQAERNPFAVSCEVDIVPNMVFKTVTLSRIQTGSPMIKSIVQYELRAGEKCTPLSNKKPVQMKQVLSDDILVYGGIAFDDLGRNAIESPNDFVTFMEDFAADFTKNKTAPDLNWTNPSMIGSRNRFEDLIGLSTAISVGANFGAATGRHPVSIDGNAIYALGTRVGVGQPWALIYTLPVLLSIVLVSIFHWRYGSI